MADYLRRIREESGMASNATGTKENNRGKGYTYDYKPNKDARKLRAHVWDRYTRMRDDPIRKEAERDWEQGDKLARLWRPERDPDDWRADIRLPDAFAAIQTHLQETVGMKLRPAMKPTEGSDTALAFWSNGILNHNLDVTDFDLEVVRAINCAADLGTAFTVEQYLYETRWVKDPVSVENGILQYERRELVDKDDTFTKHWANERVFVDEAADIIEHAEDCVLEERLRYDTFKARYGDRSDFMDIDKVIPCASISERSNFFDRSEDDPMDGDHVQVLHYYNKMTDTYAVLANTVIIRDSPIPFKHKELPLVIWNYYPVRGRIYGMGIPKIIGGTQEQREAIRNLSLDRQKMHLNKMFLVNDLFDLDEDEATTRPHGFIHVNSGGMPLDNVIKPLEYGDLPGSSLRMDDQLRDDEKRVTGIDDRSQGVNMGGTATEAAILTEQSQKRINLINTLTGMYSIKRQGRLKWSNVQFFYPAPRVERLTRDNKEQERKIYRKIPVEGKQFEIEIGENGKKQLKINEIAGTASFELNAAHARFFDGDWDVSVQWDIKAVMPEAIRQAKIMEMFQAALSNPFVMKETNIRNAYKDVLMEFGFSPQKWMTDNGSTDDDQMIKASWENMVMLKGTALDPTEGASEMHTLVHVWFTESDTYKEAIKDNPGLEEIFKRHILGENENGPGMGAAGATKPNSASGMGGTPGLESLPPPNPSGAPLPLPPGGGPSGAVPQSGPPVSPVTQGGEVTAQMAPLR